MIFFIIIILVIACSYIFLKLRDRDLLLKVTKTHRGTKTERELVLKLLKAGFPEQTIFHDLYLKNRSGKYSQVDLVLVTKVGLIVFEVKKYSGWIFGKGHQTKWTQVLAYGKQKYYFYNPILQNKRHIESLKTTLGDDINIPLFSVIIFYGDCEFRDVSFIPKDTFLVKSPRAIQVVKKIIQENDPVNYGNGEFLNILSSAVSNGNNKDVSTNHIQNIKDMLGEDRIFH
ncbi:MAG: NERD domain-containing protein [Flavobacterium sp.]|nr:MAG: NERD domain-containing protein [Flavobacterium sp.]